QRQLLQALRSRQLRPHRGRLGPRQPHLRPAGGRPRPLAAAGEPGPRRRRQPLSGPGRDHRRRPPRGRQGPGPGGGADRQRVRGRQAERAEDAARGPRPLRRQRDPPPGLRARRGRPLHQHGHRRAGRLQRRGHRLGAVPGLRAPVSQPEGASRARFVGEAPAHLPAGPLFATRDPAPEAVIERLEAATAADADAAVERAAAAFETWRAVAPADRAGAARRGGRPPPPPDPAAPVERAAAAFETWRSVAPADRARLLRRLAERLDADRERLAQLEMRNTGKPIGDARGELGMVVDTFAYYAAAPERLLGDTIPVAGGVDLTFREPLGVVGLIVPWNFPLTIASWKLAPALAAGNTVVLKPAGLTPLTALAFQELAEEAGIAPGVVNVLAGPGRVVGQRLVEHPGVAKIAFTGSTEVGRGVMQGAAGTIKRVT